MHQEHQKSESRGLENRLKETQSNIIAVVSPDKGDHATDLFTLHPVNNSEEYRQKVVAPDEHMKMEIQRMSLLAVAKFVTLPL